MMNYKRLMTTAFAAVACVLCRADAPAVGTVWTEGGLNYKVSQKADESLYLTLTGWVSATNEVIVPATVTHGDETLSVLAVADGSFRGKTTITNLVLSEGIEYIGTNAFYGCNKLLGVNLPDSVTVVAREAFYNCTAMTGVLFGSGLLSVEDSAFLNCNSLGEVVLPDSLTSLGNSAFYGCNAVTNFVVGSGLARVELGSGAGRFPQNAPMHFTVNGNGETVIGGSCIYSAKIRSLTLRGVRSIEDGSNGSFNDCNQLASVHLGDDLVHLGKRAFYGCKALSDVSLPNSLREIGERAFYLCTNLHEVAFGSGVSSIGDSAFASCSALRDVEIPASVTNVAEFAFNGCSGLTNFVRNVGGGRVTAWFPSDLDNLETIRIVGNGEATIAPGAFRTSSTRYTVKAGTVELVGIKAIEGTSGDGAFRNAQIGVLTMDDAMLDIGDKAFYGAKLGEIAIADSVTNIGANAFYNCSTLSNFVMGAGVQTIGQSAFVYCYKIPEILLPDSLTNLGRDAFTTCTAVTNIVIGSGLELIEPSRFPESVSATLTVNGSGETVIADGAFGSCKIRSATLRGVKKLGTGSSGPFRYCSKLETVEIGEGLVEIGEDSFYHCSALGSISLPDSLRVIGRGAFTSCTNLRNIVFGPNVGEIGQNAFYYCSGLTDLEIPATVTNVQSSAFSRCPGITNVVIHSAGGRITSNWLPHGGGDVTVSIIGDGETTIAPKAFYSDTLYNNPITPKTVKFSGVKAIENASHGNGAFFHSEVESIDLGSAMRNIGDYAFQRAERLEFIDVPGSVTNIGREAFSDSPRLSRVRLRDGLVSIGAQAFNSCKAIAYIEIPSTVTQIASSAFQNSSHSLVVFFRGPPPEGIGSIAFVKGARVVRPKAYAAEWEGVTVSANAKIVPEPEEGVTWTVNTDRDWAHLDGIEPHSGTVLADETWTADKVHVVRGWVTVTNGVSVTVERGAVVKFCPGMGVYAMPDARFDVSGATVTHIRDDGIAGDTDGDSGLFKPVAGDYSFMGWIDEDSGTSWRCRLFHVEGDIASDTVWAGGGNVYYADDNITVNSKIALTVEPGAIVKFAENKRIVVHGTLNATGTRQEPVYFTSCHDDTLGGDNNGNGDATNPNWGDWYHIIASGAATFDHAILRYGGTRSSSYTKGVVIADNGGDVRLSCCTIAGSWNMGVWAAAGSKRMAVENQG